MSDDIVTRLRMSADLMVGFPKMLAKNTPSQWLFEAADEIERLREQLALWKKTAKHIRYHHCKPIGCKYCAIYAEEYPNDPVVE